MMLSNEDKDILRNHLVKVNEDKHNHAIIVFKGDDVHVMNDSDYINCRTVSIDLKDNLTINEIQEVYNNFIDSIDLNTRVKSYGITSYCDGESYDMSSTMSIDFIIYTITHDVESKVNTSVDYILRDFEFKYMNQRNGKDVANRLKYFDKIGIDISKF